MTQYIDKSALVAEFNRLIAKLIEEGKDTMFEQGRISAFEDAKLFLDTLEVKEEDLEKYYHEFLQKEWFGNSHVRTVSEMMAFTAKHFFELGLKAQHSSISIPNIDDIFEEEQIIKELQEEPISEELEKAANEWDAKASFTPFYMALDDKGNPNGVKQDYTTHAESFKAGAKWQKEKDDEEKVLTYKHGFEDCKKQMIAKAIDANCFGFQGAALFSFRLPADNYLVGSKVKVILINED